MARAFEFLGKRWNGVILGTLRQGPTGFAELRRGVGSITDSVLSDRLGELVRAGLVQREVTDTRPPGVTYSLTAKGQALGPILDDLGNWAADLPPVSTDLSAQPRQHRDPAFLTSRLRHLLDLAADTPGAKLSDGRERCVGAPGLSSSMYAEECHWPLGQ